jgi:hypothetical protein
MIDMNRRDWRALVPIPRRITDLPPYGTYMQLEYSRKALLPSCIQWSCSCYMLCYPWLACRALMCQLTDTGS